MVGKRHYNRKFKIVLFLCFFLLSTLLVFINFTKANTGSPSIISYQGRLADPSGNLLAGTFYLKFSIWDSPTSSPLTGNRLWPTNAPQITTTTVTQGVFNVNIGDIANGYPDTLDYDFLTNADVYLQVDVSDGTNPFETLSPRQRISSSGFAINANNVSG